MYKADGTLEKKVKYIKGQSLILSVLHAAEGIRGEKGDANYERINKVLVASGLDYKSGIGWYAKTEAAIQAKNREIAARQDREAMVVKKERILDRLGRAFIDALTLGGIYKEAAIANQQANKQILEWVLGVRKEEKKEIKIEPEQSVIRAELEKRYNEVAGKPYTSDLSDEVLNSNGAVTKESKGMNCIGFVSYVFGFNCRYDVSNFHLYSEFEKLQITSVDQLKVGDVIRWMGINKFDNSNNNHVMIWYGNDTILESAYGYGVQTRDYPSYLKWFNDRHTNITVDYFRFKGSKRTGGSE